MLGWNTCGLLCTVCGMWMMVNTVVNEFTTAVVNWFTRPCFFEKQGADGQKTESNIYSILYIRLLW